MAVQRAVIVRGRGQVAVADDVPIPTLPDDYILVKTQAGKCELALKYQGARY